MSSDIWSGVPKFTHGQVMSAYGHLNLLVDDLQWIKSAALGGYMPMRGGMIPGIRNGFLRHKHNVLRVMLAVGPDEEVTVTVKLQGDLIYTHQGAFDVGSPSFDQWVIHEFTYDLAQTDIDYNQIYELTFETTKWASDSGVAIIYAGEIQDETPYGDGWDINTDCHNDDVLSAAQWQAIADYVDALHERVTAPRTPVIEINGSREQLMLLNSEVYHRGRWLELRAQVRPPQGETYRTAYLEFAIWLNTTGTTWVRRIACVVFAGDTPHDYPDIPMFSCGSNGDNPVELTYENGTAIDLRALDFGGGRPLLMGDRYVLAVNSFKGGGGGDYTQYREGHPYWGDYGDPGGEGGGPSSGNAGLAYIHEFPDPNQGILQFIDPSTWTPLTDYVYDGVEYMPGVWELLGPAMLLHDLTYYQNQLAVVSSNVRHCTRQHRYLHYTSAKGVTPKVSYYYNEFYHEDERDDRDRIIHHKGDAKKTEATLASAYSELELLFLAYDLTTIEGLWPGVEYTLEGVLCAFEDTEP